MKTKIKIIRKPGPGDGYTPVNKETGDKRYGKVGKGTDPAMNKALNKARSIGARFTEPTATAGTKGKKLVFYAGDTQPIQKLKGPNVKPLPTKVPKINISVKQEPKKTTKTVTKVTPSIANVRSTAGKPKNPAQKFASVSKGNPKGASTTRLSKAYKNSKKRR